MADDDRLLELLGRALAPPPVEPPPERVAAFRALIAEGRPVEQGQADLDEAPEPVEPDPPSTVRHLPPIVDVGPAPPRPAARPPAPPPPRPTAPRGPVGPPPPPAVPDLSQRRARRVGWLAAGATVAAAAVVMAVLAVPNLVAERSKPQTSVETAREAVARLQTALAMGDPIAVAEADAHLGRVAGGLPKEQQKEVHAEAVAAHVKAVEFLRESRAPVPAPQPSGGQVAAPGTPVPQAPQQDPATTVAPADGAVSPPPAPPPAPTTVPPARSVTIIVVSPEVDGTFQVVFGTAGFTPAAGRKPGTYAIRFSFDDGQSPTIWTKSEPWRFPREQAVTYRQVCARVVDANGVEDPASGGCRSIL